MITLYGMQSQHVARVRAALIQKGLDFQHVSVNLGQKSEEFRKLTPVEKIPVLEDNDGTIIWDSTHILEYLDEKYPDTYKMMGRNAREKAKILNVVAIVQRITEVLPPLYIEKFSRTRDMYSERGESHRFRIYNEQEKNDAKKDIAYRLQRLEKILNGQKFFTGQFSGADAALLSEIGTLEFLGIDIGSWKEWKENLMRDEKIAKMFVSKEEKGIKEI